MAFPSQILHCGQLLSSPQLIAAAEIEFFVTKISNLKRESSEEVSELSLCSTEIQSLQKKVPRDGFNFLEGGKDGIKDSETLGREESFWSQLDLQLQSHFLVPPYSNLTGKMSAG